MARWSSNDLKNNKVGGIMLVPAEALQKMSRDKVKIEKSRRVNREDFKIVSDSMINYVKGLMKKGNCHGCVGSSFCPFSVSNSPKGLGCVNSGYTSGSDYSGLDRVLMKSCEEFLELAKEVKPESKATRLASVDKPEEVKLLDLVLSICEKVGDPSSQLSDIRNLIQEYKISNMTAKDALLELVTPVGAYMVDEIDGRQKLESSDKYCILAVDKNSVVFRPILDRDPIGCTVFDTNNDRAWFVVNSIIGRYSVHNIIQALGELEWI